MKQIVILFVTIALCLFGMYWDAVDRECRKSMGWELYTIYPEPICHVEKNMAPLQRLKAIREWKEQEQPEQPPEECKWCVEI